MIVFPNAKINIGLNIIRRRSDGYHDLETIMMPIPWYDILEIVPAKGERTTLTVSGRNVNCPPEKNLVIKAYKSLAKIIELPPADIYLHKIIPDGAGLGGGSSDAAFTLTTLNRLFSLKLSKEALCDVASSIGADCPFFIYNSPMLTTGTGTELTPVTEPLNLPPYIAVIKPPAGISTAEAYSGVTPHIPEKSLSKLIKLRVTEWNGLVVNDFEQSIFKRHPEIAEIKHRLSKYGAIYTSMSGSGSAVYGFFEHDILAENFGYESTLYDILCERIEP